MSKIGKAFWVHSVDNGFCRVNYVTRNPKGPRLFYCLQDEGNAHGGVICYRCSHDFEPSHAVEHPKILFEIPEGNSDIEQIVRDYLTKE